MSVALVTGGARRVGAAIASRLARDMAVLIHASARSQDDAQALADRLSRDGGRAAVVVADLADAQDCEGLVERAARAFGPLTLLVNNASIFEDDSIATFDAARFERAMAVNLRAPLLLAKTFAAQAPEGASIVNLLDQRVLLAPDPLFFTYSLTKAGLAAATSTLAQALAPRVRVNAVAPGPVLPNAHDGAASFEAEVARVPLEKAVPVEAVADAVAWLAGAAYVTGETIAVDSGQRLAWRTPDVTAAMGADETPLS